MVEAVRAAAEAAVVPAWVVEGVAAVPAGLDAPKRLEAAPVAAGAAVLVEAGAVVAAGLAPNKEGVVAAGAAVEVAAAAVVVAVAGVFPNRLFVVVDAAGAAAVEVAPPNKLGVEAVEAAGAEVAGVAPKRGLAAGADEDAGAAPGVPDLGAKRPGAGAVAAGWEVAGADVAAAWGAKSPPAGLFPNREVPEAGAGVADAAGVEFCPKSPAEGVVD